jgi:hypothetical protein
VFAALENLNDSDGIIWDWDNIKAKIRTPTEESLGLYEFKQHKPWFDGECLRFLDKRKQAKMQSVLYETQRFAVNLNKV